jgi:hypothetical protein
VAEITPHIIIKVRRTSTALYKGSENRLIEEHITFFQKMAKYTEKKVKKNRQDAISNNI